MNIMTVFTVVMCLVVSCVVFYGYVRNSDIALFSAHQLIRQTGASIGERTQNMFDSAFMTVNSYAEFPEIGQKPSVHSHPMSSVFFKCLQENPDFTSVYIGFADGDFYLVSSLRDREQMKKEMNIPEKAAWYTQSIGHLADGRRYELKKYLDAGYVTIGSSSSMDVRFDPRVRPWFISALSKATAVLNDVYVFAFSGEPGLTVSRRFDSDVQGVIGVDISLANLSSFMKRQMVGDDCEIMIFGSGGELYGYQSLEKLSSSIYWDADQSIRDVTVAGLHNPVLNKLAADHEQYRGDDFRIQQLLVGEKKYLSLVDPLPQEYGRKLFVAVAVPESFFTGPIAQIGKNTLLASMVILLLFLPIVYMVAKRISRPLKLLTGDVENIRRFNLDRPVTVRSSISEIRALSIAMETMRSTLNVFGRYIPRPLVESMIVSSIIPELGGERKNLTFMFSDIKNFTSISENMSPEELTAGITSYLKAMSRVILISGGTIDKYIGDAIMAFWNAPVDDCDHARNGCLAALRCRDELADYNRNLRENNKPEMLTRIGLHTGEAVVGNIGSSDRMAYTAMGAAVNLASRLEGLNKYLGTGILVSESTMQEAGSDFLFRFAGRVVPKGTSSALGVYELLGTVSGAAGPLAPFAVLPEEGEKVADWEKAFDIFLSGRFSEAAAAFKSYVEKTGPDPLADYYLVMAERYTDIPPGEGWMGEVVFDAK